MFTQVFGGQLAVSTVLCGVAALTFLCRFFWNRSSFASTLPLPPGPRPLPIVGNLFDIPKERLGAGFRQISERYGISPLIRLRISVMYALTFN